MESGGEDGTHCGFLDSVFLSCLFARVGSHAPNGRSRMKSKKGRKNFDKDNLPCYTVLIICYNFVAFQYKNYDLLSMLRFNYYNLSIYYSLIISVMELKKVEKWPCGFYLYFDKCIFNTFNLYLVLNSYFI